MQICDRCEGRESIEKVRVGVAPTDATYAGDGMLNIELCRSCREEFKQQTKAWARPLRKVVDVTN